MEAYANLALVYDEFMDNVPYEEWAQYLHGLFEEYQITEGLMCELGCGTGSMTELMADYGYDMIGIDNSEEMLEIAQEKKYDSGHEGILYLLQDMREFELYGTVSGIYSVCDSVNYITDKEDLLQVFRWVNNYLDPKGVFIFDFNTEHKYRDVIGQQTIAENRDDCSFIWENFYDNDTKINTYELTLFLEVEDGLFERQEEVHYQRGYTLEEMKELIEKSGMEFVTAYDAFTKNAPDEKSERVYVIAKECGK